MQARRIEAREPHVAHQHHAQRIAGVAESVRQRLAAGLISDQWLPVGRIGDAAGHHYLEPSLVIVLVMPVRAQKNQLAVEVNADTAAHTDDHRLAVHSFQALFEVGDDVLGDELQPIPGPDEGFQLCPFGLESLLTFHLFTLGRLLELRGRSWAVRFRPE